jgi:hypothetical protein
VAEADTGKSAQGGHLDIESRTPARVSAVPPVPIKAPAAVAKTRSEEGTGRRNTRDEEVARTNPSRHARKMGSYRATGNRTQPPETEEGRKQQRAAAIRELRMRIYLL